LKKYDFIVVGAGPAGSFFSSIVSKNGYKTLLIEKKRLPGDNIHCGEALSKDSITDIINIKKRWISSNIKEITFFSPFKSHFTIKFPGGGWILNRRIFDYDLFIEAAKAGTETITGNAVVDLHRNENYWKVKLQDGGIFYSKLLIGSDGLPSLVGKTIGLTTPLSYGQFYMTYQYLIYTNEHTSSMEFFFGNKIAPGGYGWVFSKGNGTFNAGVGIDRKKTNRYPEFFLKEILKFRFKKYSVLSKFGSGIPAVYQEKLVDKDKMAALIGDAARLADPFTGGGIAHALTSAKILGESIVKNGLSKTALLYYEKKWKKTLGKNIKWGINVKKIIENFSDKDLEIFFKFGIKKLDKKKMTKIHTYSILRDLFLEYPYILKYGRVLLKGRYDLQ